MRIAKHILLCLILNIVVFSSYMTFLETSKQEMPNGGLILLILIISTYCWTSYHDKD